MTQETLGGVYINILPSNGIIHPGPNNSLAHPKKPNSKTQEDKTVSK